MSKDSSVNPTGPDVLKSAFELAQIIKEDSDALDTETWSRGDQFLSIANDPTFGKKIAGLSELKISILKEAIEDLANRGQVLSEAFLGLTYFENNVQTFVCQNNEIPLGKVVFKISIKDLKPFLEWRQGVVGKVSEDDINSGIYRLAALWAELL